MPKSNLIYMDYASSASVNPSSIHKLGVEAKRKLENARKEVASILSARTDEIIFTSGGTESNNLAILGIVNATRKLNFFRSSVSLAQEKPMGSARPFKNSIFVPHIITTNIEHASVLETCKYLKETKQAEITFVPVEDNGTVDPKKIKKVLKPNTVLVSVMYANNEIGTVQPIREIAKEIRHYKKTKSQNFPYFHTDAVQAVNYLDLNVEKLGIDMMSLSGSKIENSGRVGVLYKKAKVKLSPIMHGGDQEQGLRPGTENLKAILEFSSALKQVTKIREKELKRIVILRDYFVKKLKTLDKKIILNGDAVNRLPNNINITIPNIPSDLLVIELSTRGVMVSAKSACKSGDGKASYVIEAIRKDTDLSRRSNAEVDGSLRFSLGRKNNKKDVDYTLKALKEILTKLQKWYN